MKTGVNPILRKQGKGPTVDELIARIKHGAVILPHAPSEISLPLSNSLVDTFARDLALYTVAVGYTDAARVTDEVLKSLARVLRGNSDIDDQIIASDTVVVATSIGRKDLSDWNDGFRTGHYFVVTDSLKGRTTRKGDRLLLRQASGPDTKTTYQAFSGDLQPIAGRKYLLFLSSSYYQILASESAMQRPSPSPHVTPVILIAGAYELGASLTPATKATPAAPPLETLLGKIKSLEVRQ